MGNQCSQCCKCDCAKADKTHGHLSPSGSVYRRRININTDEPVKHIRISSSTSAVHLAVDHVQCADAERYTLYAHSKSAKDSIKPKLELHLVDQATGMDPPNFVRRLSDLSVKVGTRTRLLVEIKSTTDVTVKWYRNNHLLCDNDRVHVVHEGNFYCLEISPVTFDDGGQWMCMATNLEGRNSCIANINVLVPKAYKRPEFVEELRAVLTEQGTVSLECKVVGVPTPILRWFKDSKEIKAGDVFALTANPDDPTSLGTYTCEAVNCMGKAYSGSKVHVMGRGSREGSLKPADNFEKLATASSPPPIFTQEMQNVALKIGETLTLGCQVMVPPWPKVVAWYNKEGRIDTNEKYHLIEDGLGSFMIEVKPSECCDDGEWKCVVTSNEGSVGISTANVTMEIPKNYRKPRFLECLKAILTEEGLVSFECKVVGFPTPRLKWFKDGQELKPGDVYQLTGTNSLGTYCCIAENSMGNCSSTAVLTMEDIQNQLSEEEKYMLSQRNQPPKFLQGLKSQEAKINEEFKFSVEATANPEPTLSWYRDELPIESNDRYRIEKSSSPGRCNLVIGCIEFVDQAEWKCIAINDFGNCATSCFLKLLIPRHYKKPRFLESLQAILTDEGAVNLECKVIGVPQPVLKWYKDGVELKPGDIHRIISGQDGTCCLGTYTCEAKNCMGIVASSASVLGFDDAAAGKSSDHGLQRKLSLSTINEERTSQMYETPGSDITIDEKGDISFSFDGKEVSVSLYETPDLTEEEALQIVEMYADQISENISEQNIVELPPLRFMKETQQSGNLLMEAVIIDVSPDYFTHEEDLRTDAGMDDISMMEVTLHGLSEIDSEQNTRSNRNRFKKVDSFPSGEADEYFSFSQSRVSKLDLGEADEDTETDLQTFASAKSSEKQKQSSIEKDIEAVIHQEQLKEAIKETEALLEADAKLSAHDGNSKISDSDLSKSKEDDAVLRDISGEEGDGLCLKQIHDESRSYAEDSQKNLHLLVPLAKCLTVIQRHIGVIEDEVIQQSGMMMSQSSADGSIKILKNISEPLTATQRKLNVYSGHTSIEHLFSTLVGPLKDLQQALAVIEKCVSMDEVGHTMVQRTSVCVVDSTGQQIINALDIIRSISGEFKQSQFRDEIDLIVNDMQTGIRITQDTIKSQALMQEALAIEAAQHFTETIVKMQKADAPQFELVSKAKLPPEANVLKEVCRSVIRIQSSLERIEDADGLSYTEILEQLLAPIENLNTEIQHIEERLDQQIGDNVVEEKICIAILDAIRPPMYELQKTLLNLSAQPPQSFATADSGRNQILDAIFPPLQEIQNGLARIGQDVEQGALDRASPVDNTDSNRLLKCIAQSMLYLNSNIDALPPVSATKDLKHKMFSMTTDLSQLIETITLSPDGLNPISIDILEALRKPIDDLNYCLRQNEERSSSKCLGDLIGPVTELKGKIRQCQDIVLLATPQPSTQGIVTILENINRHLGLVEKELTTCELDVSEISQANEAILVLNELQHCIEALPESEHIDNMTSVAGIESLKQLVKPLHLIQQHLTEIIQIQPVENVSAEKANNFKQLEQFAVPIQDIINTLKIVTQCTMEEHAEPLSSLVFNANSFAKPIQELTNCLALIKQEEFLLESAKPLNTQQIVSKATASFMHLQTCLENVLQQIIEPSADDLSTMDNISALKTLADDITEDGTILLDAVLPTKSASILKEPKEFIDDIKKCIGNIVEHSSILEQLETLSSDDNLSELKTLVQPIRALQKCMLVQEQICVQEANDLSSQLDQFSLLKEIAKPCIDLRKNIASIEMQTKLDIAEALSQREDLKQSAQCVIDLLQSLHQFHIEDLDHISSFTDDDISLLQTWANESLAQYSIHDQPDVIEPQVIVFIRNLKNCIEAKISTNDVLVETLDELLQINDKELIDINEFVKNVAEVIQNFSENISYSDIISDSDVKENLKSVKTSLSTIAPAFVFSVTLRGVQSTINNCLNESASLKQPQIKLVRQSIEELKCGLGKVSQNAKIKPLVSRNTPEIQQFISSLQTVDSQLYFLQNDLKSKSNGTELFSVINELKTKLINVQNIIQDADKIELIEIANNVQQISNSLIQLYAILAEIGDTAFEEIIIESKPTIVEIDSSSLPVEEKLAETSETICEENKTKTSGYMSAEEELVESSEKFSDENKVKIFEAGIDNEKGQAENLAEPVKNINEPEIAENADLKMAETPKITLSSEDADKTAIITEIRDIVHKSEERELTPEEHDKLTTLLGEINVLGTKIHEAIIDAPIINENTAYIINKMKEQELAEELLRKSEERELTPEEMDTLKTLLAKINSLGSKIHETIVDAKIINESTADIINQLKDQVKQEDQLKKNANSSADIINEEVPPSSDDGTNLEANENVTIIGINPDIETHPDSSIDVKEKLKEPESIEPPPKQIESEKNVSSKLIEFVNESVEILHESQGHTKTDEPLCSTTTEYLKNVPAESQFIQDPVGNVRKLSVAKRYAGNADVSEINTEETSEEAIRIISENIAEKNIPEKLSLSDESVDIKLKDSEKQNESQIDSKSESETVDLIVKKTIDEQSKTGEVDEVRKEDISSSLIKEDKKAEDLIINKGSEETTAILAQAILEEKVVQVLADETHLLPTDLQVLESEPQIFTNESQEAAIAATDLQVLATETQTLSNEMQVLVTEPQLLANEPKNKSKLDSETISLNDEVQRPDEEIKGTASSDSSNQIGATNEEIKIETIKDVKVEVALNVESSGETPLTTEEIEKLEIKEDTKEITEKSESDSTDKEVKEKNVESTADEATNLSDTKTSDQPETLATIEPETDESKTNIIMKICHETKTCTKTIDELLAKSDATLKSIDIEALIAVSAPLEHLNSLLSKFDDQLSKDDVMSDSSLKFTLNRSLNRILRNISIAQESLTNNYGRRKLSLEISQMAVPLHELRINIEEVQTLLKSNDTDRSELMTQLEIMTIPIRKLSEFIELLVKKDPNEKEIDKQDSKDESEAESTSEEQKTVETKEIEKVETEDENEKKIHTVGVEVSSETEADKLEEQAGEIVKDLAQGLINVNASETVEEADSRPTKNDESETTAIQLIETKKELDAKKETTLKLETPIDKSTGKTEDDLKGDQTNLKDDIKLVIAMSSESQSDDKTSELQKLELSLTKPTEVQEESNLLEVTTLETKSYEDLDTVEKVVMDAAEESKETSKLADIKTHETIEIISKSEEKQDQVQVVDSKTLELQEPDKRQKELIEVSETKETKKTDKSEETTIKETQLAETKEETLKLVESTLSEDKISEIYSQVEEKSDELILTENSENATLSQEKVLESAKLAEIHLSEVKEIDSIETEKDKVETGEITPKTKQDKAVPLESERSQINLESTEENENKKTVAPTEDINTEESASKHDETKDELESIKTSETPREVVGPTDELKEIVKVTVDEPKLTETQTSKDEEKGNKLELKLAKLGEEKLEDSVPKTTDDLHITQAQAVEATESINDILKESKLLEEKLSEIQDDQKQGLETTEDVLEPSQKELKLMEAKTLELSEEVSTIIDQKQTEKEKLSQLNVENLIKPEDVQVTDVSDILYLEKNEKEEIMEAQQESTVQINEAEKSKQKSTEDQSTAAEIPEISEANLPRETVDKGIDEIVKEENISKDEPEDEPISTLTESSPAIEVLPELKEKHEKKIISSTETEPVQAQEKEALKSIQIEEESSKIVKEVIEEVKASASKDGQEKPENKAEESKKRKSKKTKEAEISDDTSTTEPKELEKPTEIADQVEKPNDSVSTEVSQMNLESKSKTAQDQPLVSEPEKAANEVKLKDQCPGESETTEKTDRDTLKKTNDEIGDEIKLEETKSDSNIEILKTSKETPDKPTPENKASNTTETATKKPKEEDIKRKTSQPKDNLSKTIAETIQSELESNAETNKLQTETVKSDESVKTQPETSPIVEERQPEETTKRKSLKSRKSPEKDKSAKDSKKLETPKDATEESLISKQEGIVKENIETESISSVKQSKILEPDTTDSATNKPSESQLNESEVKSKKILKDATDITTKSAEIETEIKATGVDDNQSVSKSEEDKVRRKSIKSKKSPEKDTKIKQLKSKEIQKETELQIQQNLETIEVTKDVSSKLETISKVEADDVLKDSTQSDKDTQVETTEKSEESTLRRKSLKSKKSAEKIEDTEQLNKTSKVEIKGELEKSEESKVEKKLETTDKSDESTTRRKSIQAKKSTEIIDDKGDSSENLDSKSRTKGKGELEKSEESKVEKKLETTDKSDESATRRKSIQSKKSTEIINDKEDSSEKLDTLSKVEVKGELEKAKESKVEKNLETTDKSDESETRRKSIQSKKSPERVDPTKDLSVKLDIPSKVDVLKESEQTEREIKQETPSKADDIPTKSEQKDKEIKPETPSNVDVETTDKSEITTVKRKSLKSKKSAEKVETTKDSSEKLDTPSMVEDGKDVPKKSELNDKEIKPETPSKDEVKGVSKKSEQIDVETEESTVKRKSLKTKKSAEKVETTKDSSDKLDTPSKVEVKDVEKKPEQNDKEVKPETTDESAVRRKSIKSKKSSERLVATNDSSETIKKVTDMSEKSEKVENKPESTDKPDESAARKNSIKSRKTPEKVETTTDPTEKLDTSPVVEVEDIPKNSEQSDNEIKQKTKDKPEESATRRKSIKSKKSPDKATKDSSEKLDTTSKDEEEDVSKNIQEEIKTKTTDKSDESATRRKSIKSKKDPEKVEAKKDSSENLDTPSKVEVKEVLKTTDADIKPETADKPDESTTLKSIKVPEKVEDTQVSSEKVDNLSKVGEKETEQFNVEIKAETKEKTDESTTRRKSMKSKKSPEIVEASKESSEILDISSKVEVKKDLPQKAEQSDIESKTSDKPEESAVRRKSIKSKKSPETMKVEELEVSKTPENKLETTDKLEGSTVKRKSLKSKKVSEKVEDSSTKLDSTSKTEVEETPGPSDVAIKPDENTARRKSIKKKALEKVEDTKDSSEKLDNPSKVGVNEVSKMSEQIAVEIKSETIEKTDESTTKPIKSEKSLETDEATKDPTENVDLPSKIEVTKDMPQKSDHSEIEPKTTDKPEESTSRIKSIKSKKSPERVDVTKDSSEKLGTPAKDEAKKSEQSDSETKSETTDKLAESATRRKSIKSKKGVEKTEATKDSSEKLATDSAKTESKPESKKEDKLTESKPEDYKRKSIKSKDGSEITEAKEKPNADLTTETDQIMKSEPETKSKDKTDAEENEIRVKSEAIKDDKSKDSKLEVKRKSVKSKRSLEANKNSEKFVSESDGAKDQLQKDYTEQKIELTEKNNKEISSESLIDQKTKESVPIPLSQKDLLVGSINSSNSSDKPQNGTTADERIIAHKEISKIDQLSTEKSKTVVDQIESSTIDTSNQNIFTTNNQKTEEKHLKTNETSNDLPPRRQRTRPLNEHSDSTTEGGDQKSNTKQLLSEKRSRMANRKPVFDTRLTNRTSVVGSTIKLACNFSGPDVQMQWLKNGKELSADTHKYVIRESDGLSTIEIYNAAATDSGQYVCMASNRNGCVETSSMVTIFEKGPEEILLPPVFSTCIRGEYACAVR